MSRIVEVVAAVIWQDDKFLICQRPANKKQNPLQWEFPGGKVEPGETKEEALIREIKEELNIVISVKDTIGEAEHTYPEFTVHLTFFSCEIVEGVPEKLEHNDFAWIDKFKTDNYDFCPSDKEFISKFINNQLDPNSFIFVMYNGIPYPPRYKSDISEIAGHFDKREIDSAASYSLHTEYSYGKRKFDTEIISRFPALIEANKDNVPQLWKNLEWAESFAEFIIKLTEEQTAPRIIEIHPPFNDYCTIDELIERYNVFEKKIHQSYPNAIIVLENRSGAVYRGGKFLVGKAKEIANLCEVIKRKNVNLGIVLDFPQLLTAEGIDPSKFNLQKYQAAIDAILPYRELIKGIHIWGKKKSESGRWVAHSGNLDTYFSNNTEIKKEFIKGIQQICDDGIKRFCPRGKFRL